LAFWRGASVTKPKPIEISWISDGQLLKFDESDSGPMVGNPEVILGQDLFAGQVVSDESSDAVDQRGASAAPQVIVARAGN
jgi:hypothetical protein